MNAPTTALTHTCVVCESPATQRCTACKDSPGSNSMIEGVYYCTSECQKADWKNHKPTCFRLRARKSIYSAGFILQELFYVYKEKIFNKLIAKIETRDGKLYIHQGQYPKSLTGYDCVQPFPKDLFQNNYDKRAILVHWACSDAVDWMQEVVEYVLTDIVSNITEIRVKPKNNKLEVFAIAATGEEQREEMDHIIWKFVLKNSREEYILDFSSAQFGYYEPVTAFGEYFEHRVQNCILVDASYLGRTRDYMLRICEEKNLHGIIFRVHKNAHTHLKGAVSTWENVSKLRFMNCLFFRQINSRWNWGCF
ncbi:hypothetical protein N431DRAFT_358321 [Stipitochalara longipes BDJ]|nr:hypothetical protein N431DRAFT_358321 [Stipitochalara longipes BDJ]